MIQVLSDHLDHHPFQIPLAKMAADLQTCKLCPLQPLQQSLQCYDECRLLQTLGLFPNEIIFLGREASTALGVLFCPLLAIRNLR